MPSRAMFTADMVVLALVVIKHQMSVNSLRTRSVLRRSCEPSPRQDVVVADRGFSSDGGGCPESDARTRSRPCEEMVSPPRNSLKLRLISALAGDLRRDSSQGFWLWAVS